MVRRRATPRQRPLPPSLPVSARVETGPDGGPYEVRPVPGARAIKAYRCPGCDHQISAGTPHVVVWPAGDAIAGPAGVDDRRHWHTPCWASRATRGPTRRWS
ncbi:MAG TPA: hypothetical protein VFR27_13330 [Mycobacterium sp.]|nr:hypothetical protein [Mycobacterium sp.]